MPTPQQPPKRKLHPLAIVGIAVGGVLVLCCVGGIVLAAVTADDTSSEASAPTTGAQLPTQSPSSAPTPAGDPTPPSPTASTEPELLTIPDDLVGQNAAVAEDQLRRLGFENIQFGSADADDTLVIIPANWTVAEVAPEPGSQIRADAAIVLTCSKQR